MNLKTSTYDTIVDAAESVVIELGAARLTLDAVAEKAGVSKGGLLHHFPTKDALLEAMIRKHIREREGKMEEMYSRLPEGATRRLKAYVLSGADHEQISKHIGTSLLAALAHNPKLAEPVKEAIKRTYSELFKTGINFEKALVLCLAVDGLLFHEVLSISPLDEDEKKRVISEILRIIDEDF
ncbi:MAG: TetR/AcrR family transcriptional regulator [Syntrophorhabdaceae bacterium]|nr:TetR/AcrR family transcriptional regulator [Syntrophorhabdaceae bacterium]